MNPAYTENLLVHFFFLKKFSNGPELAAPSKL